MKKNMLSILLLQERRDVRPLLLKCGVALAISFAGFLYSRMRIKRIKSSNSPRSPPSPASDYEGRLTIKEEPQPEMGLVCADTYDKPCVRVHVNTSPMDASPSVRCSGDKEGLLLPEFDQLVREFDAATATPAATYVRTLKISKEPPMTTFSVEKDDYEKEIENLKKRIKFLRERERKLEVQLLEYYGVKEQESMLLELQNRLKVNNIEAKFFSMRIESLQGENRRLEAQLADHSKVVLELDAAKMKIKQLKRKIRHETEQSKDQILELAQKVAKFRWQEHEATNSSSDVHSDQQRLKDLEHEAEELQKSNEKLQQENDYLAQRLDSTQILAYSVLEDPEREELYKEMFCLRKDNEDLTKQVEALQSDRCADAEELVYLRWINACLRYELRNYQPPPGKTVARDLSKCLSPKSEQKAKHLILEYANTEDGEKEPGIVDFDFDHWPSSQPSYLTDDHEHDGSPCSTSSTKHHSKKIKILAKLRRLIRGKHDQSSPIIRSHSVDLQRKYSFESLHHHSCESQSPMLTSSSQNSHNSSLEYQPIPELDEEDTKDINGGNRTSDLGSSQCGVRFVLGRSSNSSPLTYRPEQEVEDDEKSDLAKYAEALRGSPWVQRRHKKSASFAAG